MSHIKEMEEERHDVAIGFLFDADVLGHCCFPGHDHIALDYGGDIVEAYKKAAWAFKNENRAYADIFDSQTDLTDTIREVYENNLYLVNCPLCEAFFDSE